LSASGAKLIVWLPLAIAKALPSLLARPGALAVRR
jgi:hypothetical protein